MVKAGWGGKRKGSGRPRGAGSKYGEVTKPIRVPVTRVNEILGILARPSCKLPLFTSKVAAGFPSPADDFVDLVFDLNDHLVKNPTSTFLVRASGVSMINAGIHPDDILIVDRSIEPRSGKIVIAAIEGELTVKRLYRDRNGVLLIPANDEYWGHDRKRKISYAKGLNILTILIAFLLKKFFDKSQASSLWLR